MKLVKNVLLAMPLLTLSACAQAPPERAAQSAPPVEGLRTADAQAVSSSNDRDLNLRAYAELLRKDMKMQRAAIITEIMQFDSAEAQIFWPIFAQYDAELTKLADDRVGLIETYVSNYKNITDPMADNVMSRVFDLEAQRARLKKRYFDVMKAALSAKTAARFFQVENQLQYVNDLQIAASLPTMQ